jgi:EmrB/QacA subfamily drug resistance transporter
MPAPSGTRAGSARGMRRWAALAVLCAAWFVDVLDFSIVNVALPAIQRDLGLTRAELGWVVLAYGLTLGGFLLLGGRAADIFGRRRLFLAGLGVFTVASLIGGLAPSTEVLLGARAVQGLGAAIGSPAALALVTAIFPEGADRNRALGIWGGVGVAAVGGGVVLGGVLTDALGWRSVLLINVPIGVAAIGLTPVFVEESRVAGRTRRFRDLDVPGSVAVTGALLVLVYALSAAEAGGFVSIATLGGLGLASILLVLFVVIESRSADPLVPLGIFRSRLLTASNIGTFVLMGAYGAMFLLLSLYLQEVAGASALVTGLSFLPLAVVGAFASVFLGPRLVGRLGVRPVLVAGMVLTAAGLALLAWMPAEGSFVLGLLPAMLLVAVGQGVAFTAATVGAVAGVDEREQGVASGLVNTSLQVGTAVGIALLLAVAAAHPGTGAAHGVEASAAGFRLAFAVGAGLTAAGAAAVWAICSTAASGRRMRTTTWPRCAP